MMRLRAGAVLTTPRPTLNQHRVMIATMAYRKHSLPTAFDVLPRECQKGELLWQSTSAERFWWHKFNWNGESIRESTKQSNKRTAEQMEASHKTSLAKGEVGLRDRKPSPTLREFAEHDFLAFARSTFAAKLKTLSYYENGIKNLLAFEELASAQLDTITGETIAAFVAQRSDAGLKVSSINRELQALRRMFHLA
jgi:hypothetical protein